MLHEPKLYLRQKKIKIQNNVVTANRQTYLFSNATKVKEQSLFSPPTKIPATATLLLQFLVSDYRPVRS